MNSGKTILVLLLITASIVSIPEQLDGQTVYYRVNDGRTMDAVAYKNHKNSLFEQYRKMFSDNTVILSTTETELYHTSDSVIILVNLLFRLSDPDNTDDFHRKKDSVMGKELYFQNLNTLDGKVIDINYLKGKPALLNFWAISCLPCIKEMPVLNEIKEYFGDQVNFVAIAYDSEDSVRKFLITHPFTFVHVINAQEYFNKLGMNGTPVNLFLDKEGRLVSIKGNVPYKELPSGKLEMENGDSFRKILRELLKK